MKDRLSLLFSTAFFLFGTTLAVHSAETKPYTTWSDYAGSPDSMQYSALTQINKKNVSQLKEAWFFHVGGQSQRLVFNPIVVDDRMYVLGEHNSIVALNAATGKQIWANTNASDSTDRGITYWESKDRSDRRLIYAARGDLRELNAVTGESILTFGTQGRVNMREPEDEMSRQLGGPSRTPPRIFENLIITGSLTGEGYGSPPGDIRAYDVLSGRLAWIFHTIPHPGEFGYDTWPSNAWNYAGGANVWGALTVDPKNGILFAPTGSPTHDLYGADRGGNNLFGNCLIALDARTGKRLWHFQTIHHDIWDYDLTSAPNLLTVKHGGKMVEVVAQASKAGFLYVFERKTGKPLWPIEERPVPKSEVPGEKSSPTQPFPTKPPPFAKQQFTVADINPFVDIEEKNHLRQLLTEARNEGVFTGSSHKRYAVEIPGAWGGANWGSTAADPEKGLLFVRVLEHPSYRKMNLSTRESEAIRTGPKEQKGLAVYLQFCSQCHGPGQAPMRPSAVLDVQGFTTQVRQGKDQMPAFPEEVLTPDSLVALREFLRSMITNSPAPQVENMVHEPPTETPLRLPPPPDRYSGPPIRYAGSQFAAAFLANNDISALGPPWTELVAYDLNEGTIKWRIPDGTLPGLAKMGITNTGGFRPRSGPVPTAGGIVFAATAGDRKLRAYDKDNGKMLWEYEIEGSPEGIPAVYEVNGRQYVAFTAGSGQGYGSVGFARIPGKIEAQGYHVFALPEKNKK